jgi:hypothetical protein
MRISEPGKCAFSIAAIHRLPAGTVILALALGISIVLINLNYAAPASDNGTAQPKKTDRLNWDYLVADRMPSNSDVARAKVPGGWFILMQNHVQSTRPNEFQMQYLVGAAFFYPDPDHTWDGTSLPK